MTERPPRPQLFPYTTLFRSRWRWARPLRRRGRGCRPRAAGAARAAACSRSEEHTSELQSRRDLVCRLLLEKKNYRTGLFNHLLRVRERLSADVRIAHMVGNY